MNVVFPAPRSPSKASTDPGGSGAAQPLAFGLELARG